MRKKANYAVHYTVKSATGTKIYAGIVVFWGLKSPLPPFDNTEWKRLRPGTNPHPVSGEFAQQIREILITTLFWGRINL